jgi:radical SAM protein with 4Fe4S-binding SPASM domain
VIKDVELPELDFPERLTIELTNNCNLDCVMCPRHSMEKNLGYMDLELYKKIINEASEHLPVTMVPFFRGESLLHPDFLEMISIAKAAGLGPLQLTTNAMCLDNAYCEKLLDSGIDFISFSLDVLGKESYEQMRRGGDYARVIGNIEKFLALRSSKGLSIPQIQVSAVSTAANRDKLSEFVEYWRGKVDRVRIYPEHSSDGSFGSLKGEELLVFDKRLPCKKVFTDMVVYWDGTVAVCNHDWERKEQIGNLSEETIASVWKGDKYKEIRKRHLDGALDDDQTCSGCDHWKMYYMDDGLVGELYDKDTA